MPSDSPTEPDSPQHRNSPDPPSRHHRARGVLAFPRLATYPLVALPVGLLALGLALTGRREGAADLRYRPARRLLHLRFDEPAPPWTVVRGLVSLPSDVLGFAVATYVWLLLLLNIAYPLRTDTTTASLQDSWGGPSLAGAWAVHAVGGTLIFLLAGLPLAAGVARLQGRLLTRSAAPRRG